MLHQITRPAREILLESLNRVNGTNFTHEDVEFTNPRPVIDPDFNSQLDLRAGSGNQFYDERSVRYNRIDLATFFARYRSRFSVSSGVQTLATVLPLIDAVYGCRLLEEDFEATSITVESGEPVTFTLRASPTSLLFFGEADLELRDYNAETPDPEPEPEPGLALDFFSAIPPMGNNAYYDRGINYYVTGYGCSNDLQGYEDVQRLTGWMEYDYTGTYACGESLNIEDSDFTPTDVAFSYYGGGVYLAREADLVSAIPEFNTNYEYLVGRIEALVNDQTQTYYGLFYNPFYNVAPEEPEEPTIEARGFFVSNPQRAALTSDFTRYAVVDDPVAPFIEPASIVTHATGPQKEIVVFREEGWSPSRIIMFRTTDGGFTWSRHPMPYRMKGLQKGVNAAYFKGSYYLQLQELLDGSSSPTAFNASYGLFRVVNLGTESEPEFDFERVADIPSHHWTGQNHTFSDETYLYTVGYERPTQYDPVLPVVHRTSDMVNWDRRSLADLGNVDSIREVTNVTCRNGKIYLVGVNGVTNSVANAGSTRMTLGVFDFESAPGTPPVWYRDWPFTEPNPYTASWRRRYSAFIATDTHLILGTDRNVVGTDSNEVGSILVRPLDLSEPWVIRYDDTGIESMRLGEVDGRVLAFGKRATDRTGAVSMVYSIDHENGYQTWETVSEEENIFNAYGDSAYVAAFDGDRPQVDGVLEIPPAPVVMESGYFGDLRLDTINLIAEGPDHALYLNQTGSYVDQSGVTNRGLNRLLPYDGSARTNPLDTSFQARISTAANGSNRAQVSSMAVDAEGRVYLAHDSNLYAWDGTAWAGGKKVIRLLANGLYDASFTIPAELTHVDRLFINQRNRLMVYGRGEYGGLGDVTINGQKPNNLVELMLDGSFSEEFTCPIPRSPSYPELMTALNWVRQLSTGRYVANVASGSLTNANQKLVMFHEDGTSLTSGLTYTGAGVSGLVEIKQPSGDPKILVWGQTLDKYSSGSRLALFSSTLETPHYVPYAHAPLAAILGKVSAMYETDSPHFVLAHVTDNSVYVVDTSEWVVVRQWGVNMITPGMQVGPDRNVLLCGAPIYGQGGGIINRGLYPRNYPLWVRGTRIAVTLPMEFENDL